MQPRHLTDDGQRCEALCEPVVVCHYDPPAPSVPDDLQICVDYEYAALELARLARHSAAPAQDDGGGAAAAAAAAECEAEPGRIAAAHKERLAGLERVRQQRVVGLAMEAAAEGQRAGAAAEAAAQQQGQQLLAEEHKTALAAAAAEKDAEVARAEAQHERAMAAARAAAAADGQLRQQAAESARVRLEAAAERQAVAAVAALPPMGVDGWLTNAAKGLVLDVVGANDEPGTEPLLWERHDGANHAQQWRLVTSADNPDLCFVESAMGSGLVLDAGQATGGGPRNVCMWERQVSRHGIARVWVAFFQECQQSSCGQGSENHSQLFRAVAIAGSDSFYLENAQGSAGLVLEATDGGGQGARLQM